MPLIRKTWEEILGAVNVLKNDRQFRVVIVTGAGDRAFAAGGDLRWLCERGLRETYEALLQFVLQEIERLPQVTVAAINGLAIDIMEGPAPSSAT